MKDAEAKQALKQFEKVWPRVAGREPPPPPPEKHGPPPPPPGRPAPPRGDTETLAELIRAETQAERRYEAMAARSCCAAQNALRKLAAESRGLVKKLQTEYFLRAGDSCPVPRPPRPDKARPLSELLRQAWAAAGAAEQACRTAAAQTPDPALRKLYERAAEQKQAQRKALRDLAGKLMR